MNTDFSFLQQKLIEICDAIHNFYFHWILLSHLKFTKQAFIKLLLLNSNQIHGKYVQVYISPPPALHLIPNFILSRYVHQLNHTTLFSVFHCFQNQRWWVHEEKFSANTEGSFLKTCAHLSSSDFLLRSSSLIGWSSVKKSICEGIWDWIMVKSHVSPVNWNVETPKRYQR